MTSYQPTLAGFLIFIRNGMGISASVLPDDSVWIIYAFNVAMQIVNQQILIVSPLIYQLAVYNLAASSLLNFAQDLPGAPVVPGSGPPPLPYFANLRSTLNISSFVSGVLSSTSDEGSSQSMAVPEQFSTLTLADLQYLKDQYGRVYLSFAQKVGTLWGIT